MNTLEEGYQVHLTIVYDSSFWLHSEFAMAQRFLGSEAEKEFCIFGCA